MDDTQKKENANKNDVNHLKGTPLPCFLKVDIGQGDPELWQSIDAVCCDMILKQDLGYKDKGQKNGARRP